MTVLERIRGVISRLAPDAWDDCVVVERLDLPVGNMPIGERANWQAAAGLSDGGDEKLVIRQT